MSDGNRPTSVSEVLEATKPAAPTAEKVTTLADVLKAKYRTYKLQSPVEFNSKEISELRLKRWTYGVSVECLPLATRILTSVLTKVSPVFEDTKKPLASLMFSIAAMLDDESIGHLLKEHMSSITVILAHTLAQSPENGFGVNRDMAIKQARDFVLSLDPYDVFGVAKEVFDQNMGHLLKNPEGPTPTAEEESKALGQ